MPVYSRDLESPDEVGYILFAHGSSVESANDAVRDVAARMARAGSLTHVETAFLELGKPDLSGAVEKLAGQVSRIVVVPYFLTYGIHLGRDLPLLIEEAQGRFPGLTIDAGSPLSERPGVVDLLVESARDVASRRAKRSEFPPTNE